MSLPFYGPNTATGAFAAFDDDPIEDEAPAVDAVEAPAAPALRVVADEPAAARGAAAVYGDDCPIVGIIEQQEVPPEAWSHWARSLWRRHSQALVEHLHDIDRARRFRQGEQWLSRAGARGPWREPIRSPNTIRYVHNVIGPALDWRLQILGEQKPGFRVGAATRLNDASTAPKALGGQRLAEWSYEQQQMDDIIDTAGYRAQTDGVSFLHTYFDPDADRGQGALVTDVEMIDDVRVSANATATTAPSYWIIRKTIPLADAVLKYGAGVSENVLAAADEIPSSWAMRHTGAATTTDLLQRQQTVERFTLYCAPSRYLPDGATVIVVGDALVFLGPLLVGAVPMVRVTDGAKDPAFFSKPQVLQWLELQQVLNAALSGWLENVRKNKGGRWLARANAIVQETLTAAMDSVVEVRAPGKIGDVVMPLPGFSVGRDTMDLITWSLGRLEDLSGFTPSARGQVSGDASGRAILAAKESLERHFAGAVLAMSKAVAQWGTLTLRGLRTFYPEERLEAVLGDGRPDLVRAFLAADPDQIGDVRVDPETMMPEPRSLKNYRLDALFDKQIIGPDEYRRRLTGMQMDDIATPNALQESYALRIVELLRDRQPLPPVLWPEDESIGQTVLERELIFATDIEPDVQQAALARWNELAQQAAAKQAPPPMEPGASPPGDAPELPPALMPTGLLPGPVPAMPISAQPQTIADGAVTDFERSALQ